MSNLELANKIAEEFWEKRFSSLKGVSTTSKAGDVIKYQLKPEVHERILEMCNNAPTLVYNFYATAFTYLMHVYTGLNDIPVSGTGIIDGVESELVETPLLIHSLQIDALETFKTNFGKNKSSLIEEKQYEIPQLLKELNKKYEVDLKNVPEIYVAGVNSNKAGLSDFCLSITFSENGPELELSIPFEHDMASPFVLNNYVKLLEEIIAKPRGIMADFEVICDEEQELVLRGFSSQSSDYNLNTTLVHLFEEQVRNNPAKTALVFDAISTSYNELNQMANRLAHRLIESNLTAGSVVALQLEKGPWQIIALLAVLKAGSAYVPVDPDYPQERISYIKKDSGSVLCIDADFIEVFKVRATELSDKNPNIEISPEALAYMIYTSGSTGMPKGVLVEHRSVVNIHFAWKQTYRLNSFEVNLLQLANFSFDVFVGDFCRALLNGGKMVFCKNEMKLDAEAVYELISHNDITLFEGTPALVLPLMQHIQRNNLDISSLKLLILGADKVTKPQFDFLVEHFGETIALVNSYGVTEATIDSTFFKYEPENYKTVADIIPIGKPFPGNRVYILDEGLNPVGIGMKGEICIAGAGVAKGYHNRPELTAERFVQNPFVPEEGMYRAGDQAKWTAKGDIVFIGRNDDQIKIRGYRVELGEVENALLQLQGIDESVVIADKNDHGENELVAYFKSELRQNNEGLRKGLKQQVPEHLIPAFFVQVQNFPLTLNGKVDKIALQKLKVKRTLSEGNLVEPVTDLEKAVVEIWCSVLGISKVGLNSNFFALGGHSLKALRLVTEYQDKFKVKLGISQLFENPELESHTRLIESTVKSEVRLIERLKEKEQYELSDGQRRIWLLSQFEEAKGVYNMPGFVQLTGEYDLEAFVKAIKAVIDRHEILRTVFITDRKGNVFQRVFQSEEINFQIQVLDYSKEPNAKRLVDSYISSDAYVPFDLEKGPLLRAKLFKVENRRYVFYFNMHHIISDGWSDEVLTRDLLAYYKAFKTGEQSVLPELTFQYKDFAAWQLGNITSEAFEKHKAYWLNELSGELPLINLPSAVQRPEVKTYKGNLLTMSFGSLITKRINQFVSQKGGSQYMFLLSSLNVLLHKYTGLNTLVIGTPVAGRDQKEFEDQIGFYVNTIALKNEVEATKSFSEWYKELKRKTLQAFEHQSYPFDRLVNDLHLNRDISRNPVFDVMLAFQNMGDNLLNSETNEGYPEEVNDGGECMAKFDLEFTFELRDETLVLDVIFNSAVYQKDQITKVLCHYQSLMDSLLQNQDKAISDITVLSEDEQRYLLEDIGKGEVKKLALEKESLAELFQRQLTENEEKIALVFEDKQFTYKELDQRSNQLANYLTGKTRLEKGMPLGICLDRSEWMIVSILTALKMGLPYVPIDPDFPKERKRYIVDDSGAGFVIDKNKLQEFLNLQNEYSEEYTYSSSGLDDLIYIIYTSGSTGKPKGCELTQLGVLNRIEWMWDEFGFQTGEVVLQKTTFTFDVSVWEILLPLCWGNKMILCNREDVYQPTRLIELIEKHRVNTVHFVPSVLRSFISELNNVNIEKLSSLSRVITSGEALTSADVNSWYKYVDTPLFNLYGPTEASIDVSFYATHKGDDAIPIGRPIWNTGLFVLGENQELVPMGVTGEICISGVGLSIGYRNNPELTAEKFIDHPFKPGEKIYRTGDLGKWRPDGNIVYAGRKDNQVKIRGYRIELGEIESVLQKHPRIENAAILVRETGSQEKQLISFYESKKALDNEEIINYLSESLPSYMVTHHNIWQEKIRLTANGKIDRQVLKQFLTTMKLESDHNLPTDQMEEDLVMIWSNILNNPHVGVTDNFFQLGGHSLKIIELRNAYLEQFGNAPDLVKLFALSNILDHKKQIEIARNESLEEVRIPVAEEKTFYPVTPAQKRMWTLSQMDEDSGAYIISGAYECQGDIHLDLLKLSFDTLLKRHDSLRTTFHLLDSGEIMQSVHNELEFELNIEDLSGDDSVEKALQKTKARLRTKRFELDKLPLIRGYVYQVAEQQNILAVDIHHIICDGWSVDLIQAELFEIYDALLKGSSPKLPELKIQYKDYALWHLLQLEKDTGASDYWASKLKGELNALNFPTQLKRPGVRTFNGKSIGKALPKKTVENFKEYLKQKEGTAFTGVLALLNVLVNKYTNQDDIIIGTPLAGRENTELKDQVGLFVNTVPLRTVFDTSLSFNELFELTRQTVLEGQEFGNYPFDQLIRDLNVLIDPSRNPLFDILLLYRYDSDFEKTKIETTGLTVRPFQTPTTGGQVDLTFEFVEGVSGELGFNIIYNTDLFEEWFIHDLSNAFVEITTQILHKPQTKLAQLDACDENQLDRQRAFNKTEHNFTSNKTLIAAFKNCVAEHSERTALIFGEDRFSFTELDQESDALCYFLMDQLTIKAGDFIGVLLERGPSMITALLAVQKLGCAYVPIDPDSPIDRKEYILRDCKSKAIVDSDLIDRFNAVRNDYQQEFILAADQDSSSLAYVIYTSGSTGLPKGCELSQRGVMNRIDWMWNELGFEKNETVLQKTNFTFDVSVWEIFLPLCWGNTMVLASKDDAYSPDRILELIRKHGVNTVHFVPSLFKPFITELATNGSIADLSLKRVITSGEALSVEDVNTWYNLTEVPLYNLYGPTEASIDVTFYKTRKGDSVIPIGKPIWNTQLYVLNEQLQRLPIGASGDIYIGGIGLAEGYLNRPELTNERFLESPFDTTESKLYKTGDIGKWQPDGNLIYLGRSDNQIKLRGYRIELGEIESALQKYIGISNAVVVLHKNKIGNEQLVAFYTGEYELEIAEVKQFLGEKIPAYMIPFAFIFKTDFPLNSSGKVDRRKLVENIDDFINPKLSYVAPETEKEIAVARIYSATLGLEKVGRNANFFELGGDSIKGIQVVSKLRHIGFKTSVADIMRYPELSVLAANIKDVKEEIDQSEVIGEFPLNPIQIEFFNDKSENKSHYNQSVLLRLNNVLGEDELIAIFDQIGNHHDALRLIFDVDKQHNLSVNENKGYEFLSTEVSGNFEEVIELINEEQRKFDLKKGPLLKVILVQSGVENYLGLILHHLVVDGVSWRILLEDLNTLYTQSLGHGVLNLPPKTNSFKDWVNAQYAYDFESDTIEKKYWQKLDEQEVSFIHNYENISNKFDDSAEYSVNLDIETTEALYRSNYAFSTDINDLILAALSKSISKIFSQPKVKIFLEGHGREDFGAELDVTRTIGWFTSIFPVVFEMRQGDNLAQNIVKTKEILRKVPNKGLGYGMYRCLSGSLSKQEQKEVIFNFLGDFDDTFSKRENTNFEWVDDAGISNIDNSRERQAILEISGVRHNRALSFTLAYNTKVFNKEEILNWVDCFANELKSIAAEIGAIKEKTKTPGDLTYKGLSIEDLDLIRAAYGQVEDVSKLSPLQEGIFYHWLKDRSPGLYFEQFSYRLKGKVDVRLMEESYRELKERNTILRTSFSYQFGGIPLQIISENVDLKYEFLDLSGSEFNAEKFIAKYKREDENKGFDLENGSQMRLGLIKINEQEYEFVWSHHHILMDGWGMALVSYELFRIYECKVLNTPLDLPSAAPYTRYVEWLDGLDEKSTKAYWADYLQGFGQITTPNFNPVKRSEKNVLKKSQKLVIPEERFNQLKAVASTVGITTNHIFRGLWAVLLSKINNTNDVLFGAVVSGRPGDVAGIDTMIGLFINTIPVRLRIDQKATWETILNDLKIDALNAEKHQYHQLAEVQNLADLDRDIFDHILLYQNFPVEEKVAKNTAAGDVEISDVGIVEQTNFDLIVLAEPTTELSIRFDYNVNVYFDKTITKLINWFDALLTSMLKSQQVLVHPIEILDESEKKWLLEEVNQTNHEFRDYMTIADLFIERIKLSGDEIALLEGDQKYTYLELGLEINQLSNFLVNQLSLKKGERVGVFCERGKSRVVTMMAIVKAGGAYLPIEPELPEERIVFMLRDAGVKVLLTDNQLIEYANRLQWRCDDIKDLVCTNTDHFYSEFKGLKNELMRKELWDHVGETTTNDISGGGWMSSYTGEYFSKLEMDEYAQNAFLKLEKHLKPDMKVLEIGCSSGITMFKIAPKVAHYSGVDLSSTIVENTRKEAIDKGLENVSVQCLPAHEIDHLEETNFDLVIINSVIHCFNGHNYLLDVLNKAITKCKDQAILFLGDLLDEGKRDALVEDMLSFKASHPDKNYRTKTDWSAELFIAKDFLKDLTAADKFIASVEFSDKIYTVENELTKFRYDAVLSLNKLKKSNNTELVKRQYDRSHIQNELTESPSIELNPEDDIYVIYTSGSTGTPKGCILKHRGIVNRIDWMWHELGFKEGETVLQKTTYAFDVSVWEFFLPLCWGNKMVIAEKEDVSDPERLIQLIRHYEINTMHFVPSMLKVFLAHLDTNDHKLDLSSLKRIITSGEALPSETVKSWYGNFDVPLHNLYGPTEASIDVSYYTTSVSDTEVPIGAPIWNTQLYVLNENQELVPPGVPGEICIAGVGLASGYLNREDLTNERFPQNPFKKGEKIYRTGDLGRWREDGNLLYLGRIDHQVKIRGYRIELGEIENVLEKHPQVKASVLIVIENNESEKDLVAYYVADEKIELDDLRNHLSMELPAYMIPSFYVHLTEIPLTSNGKVNRKKLPHFDGNALVGELYVEPGGETETALSKIFAKVLNLNKISITSSFFLIGGDSIKAIRLISQINAAFETSITIGELYANNTVKKLGEFIEQNKGQKRNLQPIYERFENLKQEVLNSQKLEAEFTIVDAYPMSDIEKGMVFESLVSNNDGTYHDQFVYELHFENFNEPALKKALQAMVQKHPKLRSGYNIKDFSTFVAVIYDQVPLPMEVIDLSLKNESEQKEIITKCAENSREKGFDIENFPLWKLNLFIISETDQVLLWEFHHAILDGWSSASFVTELNNFYINQNLKGEVVFDDLKITYKDFVAEEIYNNEDQNNSDFWENELATHEALDILSDKEIEVLFEDSKDAEFFLQLEQTASELKTTVKSLAFAAYLYTIHSLVYQSGITVGVVSNTRPAKEDGDKILGCFLNTLPFNIEISESEKWSSLIKRVDQKLRDIKKHELTLFKIGEVVGVNKNRANPFFDTFFNYVDFHVFNDLKERDKHDSDRLGLNKYQKTNTNFDVDVDVTDGVFTLFITQSLELKSGITAERFSQKYFHVLEQIIHNPEQHANASFLLNEDIKQLVAFNNEEIPTSGTILTEFDKVVAASGEQPALSYAGETLTFNDLDIKAARFAHFLLGKGVEKGDFVAVEMERSDALVVSILGILKAGATYVPIDTSYPQGRIDFILSDSGAKLKVDANLWEVFYNDRIDLEGSIKLPEADTDAAAYVIYTSGTTGQPKGVVISHGSLHNYLLWARDYYGEPSTALNFGLFTSIAFDLTVTSLFLPLISGGELTVFSNDTATGEILNEYLSSGISHIKLTPAHINLIDALGIGEIKITHAVVGGDTLHKRQVEVLKKLNPDIRIFNEYGPTESTVGCIVHEVENADEILIGKPIANTQISILNSDRTPCAPGVTGEIFIGGKGLANGYLNRPDLSASSFVNISVFGENQRRYASGDLGYWLPSGEIFYLGRKDNQVKVNGFRIEPAEVEAGVLSVSGINEVAVIAVDLDAQTRVLAAYFASDVEYTVVELKQVLGEHLPEYMIPSHFIQLEKLPLTTNGKIDKKALPPIGELSISTGVEYQAPGNAMEARMVVILSEELNQNSSTIGVNDNFFDIGADSIKMMRILSRVNRELELELKIVTLFEYTTVALLVEHILDRGGNAVEEADDNIADELDEVFDFM